MRRNKMIKVVTLVILLVTVLISHINAVEKTELDISNLGIGAAVMGYGGWYAGSTFGPNSAQLNPGSLSFINLLKTSSMYASLAGEFNYIMASGVVPLGDYGTLGLSYMGQTTDADFERDANNNVGQAIEYKDNVYSLSWGTPKFFNETLGLGIRAKYYDKGWEGLSTSSGNATGYSVDVGATLLLNSWSNIGFTYEDALSELEWNSNAIGEIPATFRVGYMAKIIGPDSPFQWEKQVVIIGGDVEYLTGDESQTFFHGGIAYEPLPYLTLRAGADQVPYEKEVETDLTLGVGLKYAGISFDYAYHPYGGLAENDTHFFSLSFHNVEPESKDDGAQRPDEQQIIIEKRFIEILTPQDKSVILTESVEIRGRVINPEVAEVYINGREVAIDQGTNEFKLVVPQKIGRNFNMVEAYDQYGNSFTQQAVRLLRLSDFKDVEGHWATLPIRQLATLEMVNGYPDGNFSPEGMITRAEVATLLARARSIPSANAKQLFSDLPPSHWAFEYVFACYKVGLVKGYPDGTYQPKQNISRAEGITLMTRFDGLKIPEKANRKVYTDIDLNHWVAPYLQMAVENGYLQYLNSNKFEDKKNMTRAETVEVLSKTGYVQRKLDELYDWENYLLLDVNQVKN